MPFVRKSLRTSIDCVSLPSRMHKDLLNNGSFQKSKVREVCASRSAHQVSTLGAPDPKPLKKEAGVQLALFEINWKHVDHPSSQSVADCVSVFR